MLFQWMNKWTPKNLEEGLEYSTSYHQYLKMHDVYLVAIAFDYFYRSVIRTVLYIFYIACIFCLKYRVPNREGGYYG